MTKLSNIVNSGDIRYPDLHKRLTDFDSAGTGGQVNHKRLPEEKLPFDGRLTPDAAVRRDRAVVPQNVVLVHAQRIRISRPLLCIVNIPVQFQ